jgi:hypothetical protein
LHRAVSACGEGNVEGEEHEDVEGVADSRGISEEVGKGLDLVFADKGGGEVGDDFGGEGGAEGEAGEDGEDDRGGKADDKEDDAGGLVVSTLG